MASAALEKLLLFVIQHVLTDDAKKEFLVFLAAKGVPQPLVDILALIIGIQAA